MSNKETNIIACTSVLGYAAELPLIADKLLLKALATVNTEDEKTKTYSFSLDDFCLFTGSNSMRADKKERDAVMRRVIQFSISAEFMQERGQQLQGSVNLFQGFTYNPATRMFSFKLTDMIMPYLTGLTEYYAVAAVAPMLRMNTHLEKNLFKYLHLFRYKSCTEELSVGAVEIMAFPEKVELKNARPATYIKSLLLQALHNIKTTLPMPLAYRITKLGRSIRGVEFVFNKHATENLSEHYTLVNTGEHK